MLFVTIGYTLPVKPVILALIGKPLSGKDTQADLFVTRHPEAIKISTGHIIRAVREEGETHRFWPIIGPYVGMMEQGIKLPDEPIMEMMSRVIEEELAEGKKLVVIAGSPRSLHQLDGFRHVANDTGATLEMVHIHATDEETFARSARRNEGRVDDTPEIHAIRLKEYEDHVVPMLDQLRKEGAVTELDGMQPKETVYGQIESVVRKHVDPEVSLPHMARR